MCINTFPAENTEVCDLCIWVITFLLYFCFFFSSGFFSAVDSWGDKQMFVFHAARCSLHARLRFYSQNRIYTGKVRSESEIH